MQGHGSESEMFPLKSFFGREGREAGACGGVGDCKGSI